MWAYLLPMTHNPPIPESPPLQQRWLTEVQTAQRLNMSVKWLQKERLRGGTLRFAKFGSAVRYSVADIEEFEGRSQRRSTSETGPSGGAK